MSIEQKTQKPLIEMSLAELKLLGFDAHSSKDRLMYELETVNSALNNIYAEINRKEQEIKAKATSIPTNKK